MTNLEDDIERFIIAQNDCFSGYDQALADIRRGKKVNHWIWYIFPQLRGLWPSRRSRYYGLRDREEAARYLAHPLLRARMIEIVGVLLDHSDKTALEIFGSIDAQKVQSCMTLFDSIEPNSIFDTVLQTFYDGARDPRSLPANTLLP